MITALTHAQTPAPPALGTFYATIVTVIPVLFVALAVEGRFISALVKASAQAYDAAGTYMFLFFIGRIIADFRRSRARSKTAPRREPGPLRRRWQPVKQKLQTSGIVLALITVVAVTLTPAGIAVGIVVLGTVSEIVAITALYDGQAASWKGPFVLVSVIFLVIAIAIIPAAVLIRAAYQPYGKRDAAAPAAGAAEPPEAAQPADAG